MPSEISCAVRRIHKEGEANVAKERTATLRRWVSRAADLEPAERALKAGLPQFRKDLLSPKRLALFEELLLEVGHEDVDLVKDIAHGFDLTGKLPRSNVFAKRFRPAEQSESQLRSSAKRLRDGLLATIKASEDPVIDQGVLKATMKELERGFVDGPLSPDQIPEDVEQVSVHTIDVVAGMLACWLNEWFISGRPEHSTPVCKAWDLRTAYKQLPLSDLAYALDSFFVLFNIERGASEIYRQRVLPFGSTASVTSFIRTAYAIWKLGAVGLTLVWSEYFDDYLNLCGKAFARHNDLVISMFFQLLGWEISKDKELNYDALCVVLGVQVNLRDAKLGLAYLENTVKRRTEALCDIERALATGKLEPKESEKLRGRLQFACCKIFGRRPKAALKLLSQHSRQRRWDVNQLTRLALTQLKSFLESSRPRPVRARREDFVHVYVDASFEPNGHCGLGGVVFNSSGEALCWFGQAVSPVHVQKLLKAGDRERETVIFELEALVLSICLEAFRFYVERKGVVIFTDNEGVFGSFVRGHSDNASCAALIDFFACCEESLETICWLDRVPSSSNPADDPSRGVSIRGAPRVDLDVNLLSRALPEVFG
ncbi:car [Symbiodinium sp. CCMP2592]|nr:car [Symbiodinium sp. CCMP2592]